MVVRGPEQGPGGTLARNVSEVALQRLLLDGLLGVELLARRVEGYPLKRCAIKSERAFLA